MIQDNQEKKRFLKKAYWLTDEIKTNMEELDELKELSTMLKGVDYSQTKIQISGSGDATFVNKLIKLAEFELKINDKICELKQTRNNIWNAIYTLDNADERIVCLYRYLKFLDWDIISNKMYISERHVHRIHSRALNHIII